MKSANLPSLQDCKSCSLRYKNTKKSQFLNQKLRKVSNKPNGFSFRPDYCIYWLICNLYECLSQFLIEFLHGRPPAADSHLTIQLFSWQNFSVWHYSASTYSLLELPHFHFNIILYIRKYSLRNYSYKILLNYFSAGSLSRRPEFFLRPGGKIVNFTFPSNSVVPY